MNKPKATFLNPDAFRIVKATVRAKIETALEATHGAGFFGSPKLVGDTLDGVNQWWFMVTGKGTSNAPKTQRQQAYSGGAIVEGVFADCDRAHELIPRVHELLPVSREKNVVSLYSDGCGCETVTLEFFKIKGHEGLHGLYRVRVPLNIVVDMTYFEPTPVEPEP